jgi:hypothetical protein
VRACHHQQRPGQTRPGGEQEARAHEVANTALGILGELPRLLLLRSD